MWLPTRKLAASSFRVCRTLCCPGFWTLTVCPNSAVESHIIFQWRSGRPCRCCVRHFTSENKCCHRNGALSGLVLKREHCPPHMGELSTGRLQHPRFSANLVPSTLRKKSSNIYFLPSLPAELTRLIWEPPKFCESAGAGTEPTMHVFEYPCSSRATVPVPVPQHHQQNAAL